jgi:hypothetical protein
MRVLAAAAGALALAASAVAAPMQRSAAVTASSYKHSAKPVALTYKLTYMMQCGSPGKGPVTLAFPPQSAVPKASAADILLNGKAAPAVKRQGWTLVVSLPPQPKILCDSITMGTLTLTLTKGAGFANPKKPGIYQFPVNSDKISAMPQLRVT